MNMYKNVKAVNEIRNVSHMRYKSVIKSKYRHRHKYKHKKNLNFNGFLVQLFLV